MNKSLSLLAMSLAAAGFLALQGCGGGGSGGGSSTSGSSGSSSSSSSSSSGGVATQLQIEGVAATGAAIRGKVSLRDASDKAYDCGTTAADGIYKCILPLSSTAPFVVTISDSSNPDAQPLVSVSADQPEPGKAMTVNINPLTDAIARTLVAGKVNDLNNMAVVKSKVTKQAISDIVDVMSVVLGNLAQAAGLTGFNPITTPMKTDGSGLDKVLDLTQVQVIVDEAGKVSAVITTQIKGKNYTITITPATDGSKPSTDGSDVLPPVTVIKEDSTSSLAAESKAIGAILSKCLANAVPRSSAASCKDFAAQADGSYLNDGKSFSVQYAAMLDTADTAANYNNGTVIATQTLYVDPKETLNGVALPERVGVRFQVSVPNADGSAVTRSFVETLTYVGGKWKLLGNQFKYRVTANASVEHNRNANIAESRSLSSGIRFYISNKDVVGANLKAVRITGAGLPDKGLVYVPDPSGSATTFLINNNWGEVSSLLMNKAVPTNAWASGNLYRLAMTSVGVDGSRQGTWWGGYTWTEAQYAAAATDTTKGFISSTIGYATVETKTATGSTAVPATYVYRRTARTEVDLSLFEAMPCYQFEFFDTAGQLVSVQKLRLLSKPLSMTASAALPLPSYAQDTLDYLLWGNAKAESQNAVTIKWTNNTFAPVVSNVQASGQILAWNNTNKSTQDIDVAMQFVQPAILPMQTSVTLDTVNTCLADGRCPSYLPWVSKAFRSFTAAPSPNVAAGDYAGYRFFTMRYARPDGVTVYNSVYGQVCYNFTTTVAGKDGPIYVCN
ncbi:hypothetical protein [Uliginosibacterium flavum]|uniref:Carboxypeptidase regulatory-like domain-containing protein n=1 Tax=Uliginosibacterium flavum TaxID=1396831 RepID=A0ABV2TM40_9RHOO